MLEPLPDNQWTPLRAAHLLSRASFGGPPAARRALYELGRDQGIGAAVDSLLGAPVDWSQFPLPAWAQGASNGDTLSTTEREADFVAWFLGQLVNAPGPAAKMFKFYVDHFPVDTRALGFPHQFAYLFRHFDLLRTHALGNFGDLFGQMSFSEGMMQMLNLPRNVRGAVNQNYGRESLELFSLGVGGGYTEADVAANSAAFTGHRLAATPPYQAYLDQTRNPTGEYHYIDDSAKTLLGQTIHTYQDANAVILSQPACGEFLGGKLWRYFVAPQVSKHLGRQLGKTLQAGQYEIAPFLRAVFTSRDFYAAVAVGSQIKDPYDYVVSTTKLLEAPVPPRYTATSVLRELGMHVLNPPNISGWPKALWKGNAWVGAGATVFRLNLPTLWSHGNAALVAGMPGVGSEQPYDLLDLARVAPPELRAPELAPRLIHKVAHRLLPFHPLDAAQVGALFHRLDKQYGWGSDEATRSLVRQIMSLPQYQVA